MDPKNGKSDKPPDVSARTVIGVPSLPNHPALDLDMEELSGSLLLDDPPGAATRLVTTPAPRPVPSLPFVSGSHSSRPPLPSIRPPPPAAESMASVDNLQIEEPPDAAFTDAVTTVAAPRAAVSDAPSAGSPPAPPGLDGSSRPGRAGSRLPIVAAAAFIVAVALVAIVVVGRSRPAGGSAAGTPAAVASSSTSGAAVSALPPQSAPDGDPTVSPGTAATAACAIAGSAHLVGPTAIVAAGVEARAFGDHVALGFAADEHQAALVRVDPASLAMSDSTTMRSRAPIRRALPVPDKKGRLGLALDVDRKGDSLQGRRTLPLDPPLQAGATDGQLAWAAFGRRASGKLWPLDGDGAVEALRGARSETDLASVAIAFRHAGAEWIGTAELKNTLSPRGPLWRLGTLGPNVGSPALAYNDGIVVAAWADHAHPDDPWQLRWVRYRAGEAPGEVQSFSPPPGGKGRQAMSPGLTVVPGAGFLLVWTEGVPPAREVRALTLSTSGAAVGAPMTVSSAGADAGQGQAAIASGGRGVIAFLESTASGFEVMATPIACPP